MNPRNRLENAPTCQSCKKPMHVIKRAISPNGASRPKTAVCDECGLKWRSGAGVERVVTDGGADHTKKVSD